MIIVHTMKKERLRQKKHNRTFAMNQAKRRLKWLEELEKRQAGQIYRVKKGVLPRPDYITDRDIQPYLHRLEEGLKDS